MSEPKKTEGTKTTPASKITVKAKKVTVEAKKAVEPKPALTHKELIVRAERWLRNTKGCSVVLTELVAAASEVPDAIGWKGASSTLVECKTSRADFMRDKDKDHRKLGLTMGSHCYYMTPPGLITKAEVPSYWGLLEVHGRSVRVIKKALSRSFKTGDDYQATYIRQYREIAMLVSALRRKA